MKNSFHTIGLVVIGRNEGKRLISCLESILLQANKIVYVDSGSTDNSVAHAKALGVEVVQLDMRSPFSAGRARNEGFKCLTKKYAQIQYVQFIDGDCELCGNWLEFAHAYLEKNSSCAIVSGRRKEKFPETSVYNLLCDIEWNTLIGKAKACGGDFMIRKCAFQQVNGFDPNVIAGEEPEMCYRLSKMNWSIFRLDHPMTMHDAAITSFSQWWKRSLRTGHAYAQGYALHAKDGQRYYFKESARCWFWAFIFPITVFTLCQSQKIALLILVTAYMAQVVKVALFMFKQLKDYKSTIIYSIFTVIAKWPQFLGQLLFLKRKLWGSKYSIIEYN